MTYDEELNSDTDSGRRLRVLRALGPHIEQFSDASAVMIREIFGLSDNYELAIRMHVTHCMFDVVRMTMEWIPKKENANGRQERT
jgi:hypothetical protein